jgi:peptidoglycan/xylan/chitin deacetylase (PgdA/CDA1 family)
VIPSNRKALILTLTLTLGVALALLAPMSPASSATAGPDLTLSVEHSPSTFQRVDPPNETTYGGTLTETITNSGAGPTDGTTVTVTDTLPTGLGALVNNPGFHAGAVAASGPGWTCTRSRTSSCTRSDVLAPGDSYPPITITVSVANTAAALLTNSASIAGGGDTSPSSSSDTIPVGVDACPNGRAPDDEVTFSPPFGPGLHGGIHSGVLNPERPDGCTLLDAIWAGEPFASHTAFLSLVNRLTHEFVAAGPLKPEQRGKIQSAAARSQVGTANDHQVNNECDNRVAIKFDDGPSVFRPQSLQLLRDKQVHVSVFDLGTRIDDNPQVDAFQVREGHVVLNHTYFHPHLNALFAANPALVTKEVLDTEAAIQRAGVQFTFKGVRPPFSEGNTAVRQLLADQLGYTVFLGANLDSTNDWDPAQTPAQTEAETLGQLAPGEILTLHDGPIDEPFPAGANTEAALGPIIDQARARGYCFGVLDNKGNVTADRYVSSGQPIPQITNPVSYPPLVSPGTPPDPWKPTPQPLKISASHSPDIFAAGQAGDSLALTAQNVSDNPTDGSTTTITDPIPAGLEATSAAGPGWACTGTATVRCTRTDVLAPHASYPPVTITVNVASTAPASITNSPTVTGHGTSVWVDSTSDVISVTQ